MKKILILGATGLVGQAVYKYLKTKYPRSVFGTTRNNSKKFNRLEVKNFNKDIKLFLNKKGKINFIINCIGITNEKTDKKLLTKINSDFPHVLEKFCEENNIKLIHISTDAVFAKKNGACDEKTKPNPDTSYGKSKLAGETTSENSITVRTSFLGLDPINHHGYLEKILGSKESFTVFGRQNWSGCTTNQFAVFCEDLIKKFSELRNSASVFHFSPLNSPKYNIAKSFAKVFKLNIKIKKGDGESIDRSLITNYFDLLNIHSYNIGIEAALNKLNE